MHRGAGNVSAITKLFLLYGLVALAFGLLYLIVFRRD